MTHVIEGATTTHLVAHLDHKHSEATSVCGRDGELAQRDDPVDRDDLCRDCMEASPHFPDVEEDDGEDDQDDE